MKPRVFLIERCQYDLAQAEEYGQVVYLTERRFNPFDANAELRIADMLATLGFDPSVDLICLTGKVINVAILVGVATAKYGEIRLLMFDATSSAYRERIFNGAHHEGTGQTAA